MKRSTPLFCVPVMLACPIAAMAQEPEVPATANEDRYSDNTIVVTASKREQNVQDVPISMNVVGAEQLTNYVVNDVVDLQGSIPSLQVVGGPIGAGYTLRGFGSPPGNPAFNLDIAIYQDGIYGGKARQFLAPFFDLERVEVLRGPQGALLGKNTAAGAISFITASPTDKFEASATVAYSFNRNGVDTSAFVSGPISETLKARIAVKYTNWDGYLDNLAYNSKDPGQDNKLIRGTLVWEPSSTFTNVLKIEHNDFETDGNWQSTVSPIVPLEESLNFTKNDPGGFDQKSYARQNGWNISNTATLELTPTIDLVSITGYSGYKSNALGTGATRPGSKFTTNFLEDLDQLSQELRLVSNLGGAFEFVVGGYYDNTDFDASNPIAYDIGAPFNVTGTSTAGIRTRGHTFSAYASADWNITDVLKLLGSLRYTSNRNRGDYSNVQNSGAPFLTSFPHTITAKIKEDTVDPSVTLQYYPVKEVMLYASYASGSKSGGFDGFNRAVQPEGFVVRLTRTKNYEIGAKFEIADWLSADIAAYILDADDLQATTFIPGLGNVTANAAKARSKGVEANATLRPADGLTIGATAAYLDVKYRDYPGAPCIFGQVNCVQATNNIAGTRLPFAPKWSGQVRADYETPVSSGLKVGVGASMTFRSSTFIAANLNPVFARMPAYQKYNARIAVSEVNDRWSLALIGKNLGNKAVANQAFFWPFEPPAVAGVFIEEGRSVLIQATVKY